jgi:hypothetical protein
VFADRNKDLAREMTTLLSTVQLVLEVNSCCAVLGKEFGELENSG